MSRSEVSNGQMSITFGVDDAMEPGTSHTFVQVWDSTEFDQPCDEGKGGFCNILVSEQDVDEGRVIQLAKEHSLPLDPVEVYRVFD